MSIIIMILVLFIMVFALMIVYSQQFKKVPPNKVMLVFGRRMPDGSDMMIISEGGRFIVPIIESYKYLDLGVRTLDMKLKDVMTMEGNVMDLDIVCQYAITQQVPGIRNAAALLLEKSQEELDEITMKHLEGHMRGMCRTLRIANICAESEHISTHLLQVAYQDLSNMGIELISVVLRDVKIKDTKLVRPGSPGDLVELRRRIEDLEREVEFIKDKQGISNVEAQTDELSDNPIDTVCDPPTNSS